MVSNAENPSFVTMQEENWMKSEKEKRLLTLIDAYQKLNGMMNKITVTKLILKKMIAETRNGMRNRISNYPSPLSPFF